MKSSGFLFAAILAAYAPVARSAQAVPLAPGDIVITAQLGANNFGLLLIDPTTGDRTIISDNTHGTGTDLSHPFGVSLDSSGNLLVTDQGVSDNNTTEAIVRVDPLTGNRTVVSSNGGVGGGPAFSLAIGAIEVGSEIVVSNQGSLNGLNPPGFFQSVDPATGYRALASARVLRLCNPSAFVFPAIAPSLLIPDWVF
jgi:hypothetical protein